MSGALPRPQWPCAMQSEPGRYINSVSDLYGTDEIEFLLDDIRDLEPANCKPEDIQVSFLPFILVFIAVYVVLVIVTQPGKFTTRESNTMYLSCALFTLDCQMFFNQGLVDGVLQTGDIIEVLRFICIYFHKVHFLHVLYFLSMIFVVQLFFFADSCDFAVIIF